jgi:hypothetical protein
MTATFVSNRVVPGRQAMYWNWGPVSAVPVEAFNTTNTLGSVTMPPIAAPTEPPPDEVEEDAAPKSRKRK